MTRQFAYQLLTKYLQNKNLIKHCLAAEAGMKGIYRYLHQEDLKQEKEDTWGITGLLHDVDYEVAQKENKLGQHGTLIFEREPNVIPEPIAHAIKAHNFENTHIQPETDMDWSIAIVDGLTGLIVACALVHPTKKLAPLTPEFVLKRFGEKSFAKGANREMIKLCEDKLKIPLEKFVGIVLFSMKNISDELGL